ncbi:MAG: hypothetical protein LUD48_01765, partial [Prevotella sp.]|nr:hypothetical protein [Prevotella sp.]
MIRHKKDCHMGIMRQSLMVYSGSQITCAKIHNFLNICKRFFSKFIKNLLGMVTHIAESAIPQE